MLPNPQLRLPRAPVIYGMVVVVVACVVLPVTRFLSHRVIEVIVRIFSLPSLLPARIEASSLTNNNNNWAEWLSNLQCLIPVISNYTVGG